MQLYMSIDSQTKVLEYFYARPGEEIHVRALARKIGLHPNTVISATDELSKQLLIQKKRKLSRVFITANKMSPYFTIRKRAHHIEQIYRTELITYLQEMLYHPTIVLFGSFAKGDERPDSDIDLFILTEKERELDVRTYEKQLGREIQLVTYTKKAWKQLLKTQPELANNIINGITLEGYLEVLS